jgi:hypothetical protein
MTIQQISLAMPSAERAVLWLQPHVATWTAYAFALAQQADLSPEEAARLFMQPMPAGEPQAYQADAALLERQARQSAGVMMLMHGSANVHLEREGDTWLLRAVLADMKSSLELWNVSLDFFARWLGEQARLVCLPKGITCTTWLDGDIFSMQLALLSEG